MITMWMRGNQNRASGTTVERSATKNQIIFGTEPFLY